MLFDELEKAFKATVESVMLAEAFAGWREIHSALQRYDGVGALIADFRGKAVSYEYMEDPLFALCELVQEDDDLGISCVLELYMPSLRRTVRENRARSPLDLEELESAAVEGFLSAVRNLSPGQHKPHRALTHGAQRSVLAAVRSAKDPRTQPHGVERRSVFCRT